MKIMLCSELCLVLKGFNRYYILDGWIDPKLCYNLIEFFSSCSQIDAISVSTRILLFCQLNIACNVRLPIASMKGLCSECFMYSRSYWWDAHYCTEWATTLRNRIIILQQCDPWG
jgi:hypothetical protein